MASLFQQDENFGVVPPSTGKKKKARRVFGNILSNGDLNHSLSYTPSPIKPKNNSKESKLQSTSQEGIVANLFSITETQSTQKSSQPRPSLKSEISSSRQSTSTSRSETSSVVVNPFASVIESPKSTCTDTVPRSISVPSEKNSVESKLSLENYEKNVAREPSIPFYSKEERLSKTTKPYSRLTGSYPPRSRQTLPPSSGSVNQALNAARRAREKILKEKAKAAASVRGQWKEEKEEALEFYAETEKLRREQLDLQHQLSSNFSRANAHRNQKLRQAHREKTAQEAIFKSDVAREQRETLKEQEETRRRESIAARARIRTNNREGAEKLRLIKIEEEKANIEERHSASQAFQQYQKDRMDSARKNYQFKRGDAIRIRKLHDDLEEQKREEEQQSFELKLAAARDVEEYRNKMSQQRRQSLESRNALAHGTTTEERRTSRKIETGAHASFELKRAADKDVEAYNESLREKRRESLASRGDLAQKYSEKLSMQAAEKMEADHESYKLKFEAEKDVEAQRQREALLRRQSLEQRGAMAREVREKELKDKAEQKQQEHNSWELQLAAERDVEQYRNDVNEKRRLSLKQRNEEANLQREEEDKRRAQTAKSEHESYELKWDGERDAQEYLRQLEQERRESLKARNLEAQMQRNESLAQKSADLQAEHESFELKRAANKDVDEYHKKMEQERRESLAFRNQEKARHAKVMEELDAIAREQESESYLLKWGGENDAKEYQTQLEEEQRNSIRNRNEEARRHQEIDDEMRRQALIQAHEDEKLKAAGHKDVQNYIEECAERDRNSLEYRRKESVVQRLEEMNVAQKEREAEERNQQLEALARTDVQEYIKSCKNQRRKSLALRAKEKRRNAEWLRQEEKKEVEQRILDSRLRARDNRSMELARQKEKTQKALDALRHAKCTFSTFPET